MTMPVLLAHIDTSLYSHVIPWRSRGLCWTFKCYNIQWTLHIQTTVRCCSKYSNQCCGFGTLVRMLLLLRYFGAYVAAVSVLWCVCCCCFGTLVRMLLLFRYFGAYGAAVSVLWCVCCWCFGTLVRMLLRFRYFGAYVAAVSLLWCVCCCGFVTLVRKEALTTAQHRPSSVSFKI